MPSSWFVLFALSLLGTGCAADSPGSVEGIVFDPCAPVLMVPAGNTATDELASIDEGLALWDPVATLHVTLDEGSSAPVLSIEFEDSAPFFHGIYLPDTADIVVNRRLGQSPERAVTIAHEVGHAFGLPHVSPDERPSVMNPGNVTQVPTEADAQALSALWGNCPSVGGPRNAALAPTSF